MWGIFILIKNLQTRGTLADIETLDKACATATNRLTHIRARSQAPRPEEEILEERILDMEMEKATLTNNLPALILYR